jgi:RNA polymerase sigma factor (sigma-70 family)
VTEDVDEFGTLFEAHAGDAFRLALVVAGGERPLAEDAVAEAFAATLPRWRAGTVDDLGPYVRTAVVRQLTGVFRRRRTERAFLARPAAPVGAARFEDSVVASDALWSALRQLPPKQRAAVALFYLEDQPVDEVARMMGVSVGTAKAHMSRGRDRLRELLHD